MFIKLFPKPMITKILGLPKYKTIKRTNDNVSQNAASVHTELGGGNHIFHALTVKPAIFNTISNTLFQAPSNPAKPNLAVMTGPQITAANRRYYTNCKKFQEYKALQNPSRNSLLPPLMIFT